MRYIILIFLTLGLVIHISIDKNQSQDVNVNLQENFISEPQLYGKIGNTNIEIGAKSGKNIDTRVFLEEISGVIYSKNQKILGSLSTKSCIFDIQTKILFINQKLFLRSEEFNLESTSCEITLDGNAVVFYKPKVEIL